MIKEEKSIKLGYTSGSSDKVYIIDLLGSGGEWQVIARYGKRYNYKTTVNKTPKPCSFGEAEEIFQELIRGKLRKGYIEE